jgi:hypothetical protein
MAFERRMLKNTLRPNRGYNVRMDKSEHVTSQTELFTKRLNR